MTKRLKLAMKQDILKHIERELEGPESKGIKAQLLQLWVIGLLENTDTYPNWFIEKEEQCPTRKG